MIPTKVAADDARPVLGKGALLDCNILPSNREDSTATERRNALGAGFALMRRIRSNDARALLVREVPGIIDDHGGDVAVRRWLQQEAPHRLGHAQQGCECHPHRLVADVGARQPLKVDIAGRLFVEPYIVERLTLPLLATLLVGLQSDRRDSASDVSDADGVQQLGNTTRWHELRDGILRNCAGAFLPRSTNKHALHRVAYGLSGDARYPADSRRLKASTPPPVWISAGGVHGTFESTRQRLSCLVASHQKALAIRRARFVECLLLLVRLIARQPIFDLALLLRSFKIGKHRLQLFVRNVVEAKIHVQ
jgi:hypothetical protein